MDLHTRPALKQQVSIMQSKPGLWFGKDTFLFIYLLIEQSKLYSVQTKNPGRPRAYLYHMRTR